MSSTAVFLDKPAGKIIVNGESTAIENTSYQAEVLTGGVEIIEKLSAQWIALCEEGASNEPFFRPEWFIAFVNNFEKEILLVTVRKAGKLRAVLPLVVKTETLHGIPSRKLAGVFNLQSQRFDLIHGADASEQDEILKTLWNAIKQQPKWDVFETRLVPRTSWLADLLALAESENYKTGVWQMDGAPFVTLPNGDDKGKLQETFLKGLKKHFRKELDRRLRRLKELGEVEFVHSRDYSPDLIQKYLDLEAKTWKGRKGTAAACDARWAKLHQDFAQIVAEQNALYVYELKLDGQTISMSINIKYGDKTVFWKTSFDEDYSRYAPGNLVIQEFLTDCINNGSTELDMLSPATEYKKVWATGEREHVAFYIFQRGIFGSLLQKWKFSVISNLRKLKTEKSK